MLLHFPLSLAFGLLCGVLTFAGWFVAAKFDSDVTVGGAYAAGAMLTSPIAAVAGCVGYLLVYALWSGK